MSSSVMCILAVIVLGAPASHALINAEISDDGTALLQLAKSKFTSRTSSSCTHDSSEVCQFLVRVAEKPQGELGEGKGKGIVKAWMKAMQANIALEKVPFETSGGRVDVQLRQLRRAVPSDDDADADAPGDDDLRVSKVIRSALNGVPDKATRDRLCNRYDASGVKVKHWQTHYGGKVAVFVLEANGEIVAVSALRELKDDGLTKYYKDKVLKGPVAEVGMVYALNECQGMSMGTFPFEAVLQKGKTWGMAALVLESTQVAHGMFNKKFKFEDMDVSGTTWPRKMELVF